MFTDLIRNEEGKEHQEEDYYAYADGEAIVQRPFGKLVHRVVVDEADGHNANQCQKDENACQESNIH